MKSTLLTKAALCICPPAVVATTAATVPPVRRAVHHFTAAYEPKHHARPSAPPCVPVDRKTFASMLPSTGDVGPVDLNDQAVAMSAVAPGTDSVTTPVGPQLLNPGGSLLPSGPGLIPGNDTPGGNNTPAVPEPGVWVTMVLGFGMIGAGYRQRRRYMVRSRKLALASGYDAVEAGGTVRGLGSAMGGVVAAGAVLTPVGLSPVHAGTKLAQLGSKALHSSVLAKAALCVCPPVAMAVSTAAIPPVRHAVYNATAPSVPKGPNTAAITPQGAPCVPVDVPTAAEAVKGAGDKLAVLNSTPAWPS